MTRRYLLGLILAIATLVGCSAESGPVSLPVPFTGSLTADTNIAIAVGTPLTNNTAAFTSSKSQDTASAFPISWQTVCGEDGSNAGTVTFLSTTEPEVRPFPSTTGPDKEERIYTLGMCVTLADGTELCSDDMECLEFPTDYEPDFTASNVVPNDPEAVAVVRKAACSGHNNLDGQLINAKFLMGMVRLSNGNYIYHSQQESPLLINGVPFQSCGGEQDSRVIMTILFEGGETLLPPQDPYQFSVTAPIFMPGSDDVVGSQISRFLTLNPSDDMTVVEAFTDVQLLMGSSSLVIRNSRALLHVVPELKNPIQDLLATEFGDDPVIDDAFLTNGTVLFNSRQETEEIQINCDPDASEATGDFQTLCQEHGGLRAQMLCFVYSDLTTGEAFSLEGAWVLLAP